MTEFWKVYDKRITAENHLRKVKKHGGNGHIKRGKSRGKIIYIAVYSISEKIIKENFAKDNDKQIIKTINK
jgi:hypothetical protein